MFSSFSFLEVKGNELLGPHPGRHKLLCPTIPNAPVSVPCQGACQVLSWPLSTILSRLPLLQPKPSSISTLPIPRALCWRQSQGLICPGFFILHIGKETEAQTGRGLGSREPEELPVSRRPYTTLTQPGSSLFLQLCLPTTTPTPAPPSSSPVSASSSN